MKEIHRSKLNCDWSKINYTSILDKKWLGLRKLLQIAETYNWNLFLTKILDTGGSLIIIITQRGYL